jgi:hypothetical protein
MARAAYFLLVVFGPLGLALLFWHAAQAAMGSFARACDWWLTRRKG